MINIDIDMGDLDKKLGKLPAVMERRILRKSMRRGANILKAAARANAPVGSYDKLTGTDNYKKGHIRGTLQKSITVRESSRSGRTSKVNRFGTAGRVVFFVETTQGRAAKYDAWYAHLVEFGVQPHSIRKGASVRRGSSQSGKLHPGFKPRPFMRRALDQTGVQVINEVGTAVGQNLNIEIDKL